MAKKLMLNMMFQKLAEKMSLRDVNNSYEENTNAGDLDESPNGSDDNGSDANSEEEPAEDINFRNFVKFILFCSV